MNKRRTNRIEMIDSAGGRYIATQGESIQPWTVDYPTGSAKHYGTAATARKLILKLITAREAEITEMEKSK